MRILADENFPKSAVDTLRDAGHDVVWARTQYSGARDIDLLELAESEVRILIALDKDFCQVAFQRRNPLSASGVVLFRVHPATSARLAPLVRAFSTPERDWRAHVSIVAESGIEMVGIQRV